MTIAEMRALLGLDDTYSDAAVVEAYVAYIGDASPDAVQPVAPVTPERAKRQLSVTSSDDDDLIADLIAAAADYVERETGLVLSQRQIVETLPARAVLALRRWPIVSIDAVTYRDSYGADQLVDSATYRWELARRPAALAWLPATPWAARAAPLTIVFTAGYAAPEEVPATVQQAIMVLVAEFYANREAGAISDAAQRSLSWLLRAHKVRTL